MTNERGEASDAPRVRQNVLFEGFTPEEILALADDEIEAWAIVGQPLAFRIGSATVLGEFRLEKDRLVLELAQIDEGGEGILVSLAALTRRYAKRRGLRAVEWIVHAIDCAKPNLKLRRVLKRRGFVIEQVDGIGEAYHYLDVLNDPSGTDLETSRR